MFKKIPKIPQKLPGFITHLIHKAIILIKHEHVNLIKIHKINENCYA